MVRLRDLALLPSGKGRKGAISLFVVSASRNGEFSDVVRQRKEIEVPAPEAGRAATDHLSWEVEVETASPDARISIALYDETGGRAGFRLLKGASAEPSPSR